MKKDFIERLDENRRALGLPVRAQKTVALYFGYSHTTQWRKGSKPFIATCANGANSAGKVAARIDYTNKSPSALRGDIARFEYFTKQLRALQRTKTTK